MQNYQDALVTQLGGSGGRAPIAPRQQGVPQNIPPMPAPQAAPAPKPQNASIGDVMPFLRQNYKHTPQDLQRAFAEHPDKFAGASIIGSKGDKIQFGDGKVFDVIQAAGLGGTGWQELWDNDPNAPRQAPAGGGVPQAGGIPLPQGLGGDPLANIQGQMAQYAGKSPNLQALLAQLAGGQ